MLALDRFARFQCRPVQVKALLMRNFACIPFVVVAELVKTFVVYAKRSETLDEFRYPNIEM
ncbi:hypothetical protein GCM10023156_54220 [Novipirellula rosea]|uniref:Uncharacterized protein n=1 Tax=Novipirellula rosea TaxID=1031540 RepID=A0ABP8NEF8_9BACT